LGKQVNTNWDFFLRMFSDRLRTLRGGLKQAEFARKVGLAQNSYNRYESGERIPDIDVLTRLAAHLGVSTDWLLGLDGGNDVPATYALPDKIAESRNPGAAYCPACGRKDLTIAVHIRPSVFLRAGAPAPARLIGLRSPT